MAQSIIKIQTRLMRDYYQYFSKYARGKTPDNKVAWVTAFTPVEILEALGILYYYPESYAAVIAASEKEQDFLAESERQFLCRDCCSYSCCMEGCLQLKDGPRGVLPKPDVLIATNNQCNTLPAWWNILAQRYHVPLIVLDYPGEYAEKESAYSYVTLQHKNLIEKMENLSGCRMNIDMLARLIDNSASSVNAWNKVLNCFGKKEIRATMLFDDINYLITARCKPETAELYELMAAELEGKSDLEDDKTSIFWLGYPLWYHTDRYLTELMDGLRITGSNYAAWWSLDYSGSNVFERLFHAYNYTFLNLGQRARTKRLLEMIGRSKAGGCIVLRNKSCKCDFVSAKEIALPQAELEIDMIDRKFLDMEKAKKQIELLKEILCTE